MGSRFVRPETAVLKISNGDTLTVKKRLSSGELRAYVSRMYLPTVDGTLKVSPLSSGVALVVAYLLDWSLTDDDGQPVVIRDASVDALTAALDNLEPESFTEIREAIETHEAAMAAERTAEKNGRGGGTASSVISPSLDGVVGDWIGSAV